MAFVSQELKKSVAPKIKTILNKYGVKGTLSVNNHTSLVLKIKSGTIDFIANCNATAMNDPYRSAKEIPAVVGNLSVNPYHFQSHFSGTAKKFLTEILGAMNAGNHDRSDIMTDYFDVGWYVDVNIGSWNKNYEVIG